MKMNIQDEIRRLRWEADVKEAQMKINRFTQIGFKCWQDREDVKEGDAIVTVRNDYTLGFIPHVELKEWTWYNMTMYIQAKNINPRNIEEIKSKMDYNTRCYFRKWRGEKFNGDYEYKI